MTLQTTALSTSTGAPVSVSYLGAQTPDVSPGATTTKTFNSVNIGTAFLTRIIIVYCQWNNPLSGPVSLTGGSINGITASFSAGAPGLLNGPGNGFIWAIVPTGTSVTVTFTVSGVTSAGLPNASIVLSSVYNVSNISFGNLVINNGGTVASISNTLTIHKNQFLLTVGTKYNTNASTMTGTGTVFTDVIGASGSSYLGITQNTGSTSQSITNTASWTTAVTANLASISFYYTPAPLIFHSKGDSFVINNNPWSVSGMSISTGLGSTPCFSGSVSYSCMSINTQDDFYNKTIMCNMLISGTTSTALANIAFGSNSTGEGVIWRFDGRTAAPTGFAKLYSWVSWQAPTIGNGSVTPTLGTWHSIRITITAEGIASAYVDGTQIGVSTLIPWSLSGTYIGLLVDAGGGGNNQWQNLQVYDGII